MEEYLYNMAVESKRKYKEQEEELTDFDSFMDEVEKEYKQQNI